MAMEEQSSQLPLLDDAEVAPLGGNVGGGFAQLRVQLVAVNEGMPEEQLRHHGMPLGACVVEGRPAVDVDHVDVDCRVEGDIISDKEEGNLEVTIVGRQHEGGSAIRSPRLVDSYVGMADELTDHVVVS